MKALLERFWPLKGRQVRRVEELSNFLSVSSGRVVSPHIHGVVGRMLF